MYDGGISIFGLVFFIFLVLSLILVILSIFTKKKILETIGSILMILSGICIFLLLEVGTNVIRGKYPQQFFKEFFRYRLSDSVIIIGIITIFTGAFSCISYFRKLLTKPKVSTFIMLGACALALVSAILLPGLINYEMGASGRIFKTTSNLFGLMIGYPYVFASVYGFDGKISGPSHIGFLHGGM